MSGSQDPFAAACERLIGSLLADATNLPTLAAAEGASLRAPLVAALGSIFGIMPQAQVATDVFSILEYVMPTVAEPLSPARSDRPGTRLPAIPALDIFRLLGVQESPGDRETIAGVYAALLRPDISFMASALSPPRGFGGRNATPLDIQIERAAEEFSRRIGGLLNRFNDLLIRYSNFLNLPRTGRVAAALNREYLRLYRRLAVAAVFTGGGAAIDLINEYVVVGGSDAVLAEIWDQVKRSFTRDVGSDRNLGTAVHRELQERYRRRYLKSLPLPGDPRYRILQENKVYTLLRSRSLSLEAVAREGDDGSLRAFHFARQPYQLALSYLDDDFENSFREDCVDLKLGELWEIKPIRGAALGVVQEFHYRGSFNLVNALLQDLAENPEALPARMASMMGLLPVGPFSLPEGCEAGKSAAWTRLKTPWVDRNLRDRNGQIIPCLIFVVTVPKQLPGLVIYLVFIVRGLGKAALEALAGALAAVIERLLRRYGRDLQDLVRDRERGLAVALGAVLAAAIIYLLYILAVAVATSVAVAEAAAALAAALQAAITYLGQFTPIFSLAETSDLVERLAVAAFGPLQDGGQAHVTLLADRLLIEFPEAPQGAGDVGASDILVADFVELRRMPIGRWPAFSALLGICSLIAIAALVRGGDENPQPAPSPSVA